MQTRLGQWNNELRMSVLPAGASSRDCLRKIGLSSYGDQTKWQIPVGVRSFSADENRPEYSIGCRRPVAGTYALPFLQVG
jgi:hypothetical protein